MRVLVNLILFSNVFFFFYLIIYITYLMISNIYGTIKMYHYRRMELLHNELDVDFYFPISIIVPAYNENESAVQTIHNLEKLDYNQFEIVVVDDGSTDNTKELLITTFHLQKDNNCPIHYQVPCKPIHEVYRGQVKNIPIILISKENGKCKADANNAAINIMSYPYFVCMDADEVLQKDALKYASRAVLQKENVIGVGGNIRISNGVAFKDAMPVSVNLGNKIVPDMQILEYSRAFIGSRIFQNATNSNLIISGGYGFFQKKAVIAVGGYDQKSMGEDMELTIKLHEYHKKNKIPYSMEYVPDSICWTQAQETLRDLKKQRERWHCGLMQTFWKYKRMIGNPAYGFIGMFTMPFMMFYELFCPFFILLGWVVIVASACLHMINIVYALAIFLEYVFLGTLLTITAFTDKRYIKQDSVYWKDVLRGIALALLDAFLFRPFLFIVNFFAFFKYKKVSSKWESPKRVQIKTD